MATIAPDVAHCFFPKATFGYVGAEYSGAVVSGVEPGSPASRAGIAAGDRIDVASQTLHERLFVGTAATRISEMAHSAGGTVPFAGERVTLHLMHNGRDRNITIVAQAHETTSTDIFWELWGFACHAMRLLLAVTLVLARPSPVTWAFYAYMLGLGFFGTSDYYNVLPAPLWVAAMTPQYAISHAAPASQALLWFLFPAGILAGWRRKLTPVIVVGVVIGAALGLAILAGGVFAFDTSGLERAWNAYDVGIGAIGITALGATAVASRGFERRLIGSLFAITGLAYSAEAAIVVSGFLSLAPPPIFRYVFLLGILLPLFIAYAIVRYQLFDVEYAVSRTAIFVMLGVLTAGFFIGIDALFASYFRGSRIELAVDIALALALGFLLRSFHRQAVDFVDRLFFARRFDVRMRLKPVFDALGKAEAKGRIESLLTTNAGSVLDLASAMFFVRFADGGYLRTCGYGWSRGAALWNLLPDDALSKQVAQTKQAVNLRSLCWDRTGESPPSAPIFAVPLRFGNEILGITLYGDRRDGTPFSHDDLRGLVDLSHVASVGYELFGELRLPVNWRETAPTRTAR